MGRRASSRAAGTRLAVAATLLFTATTAACGTSSKQAGSFDAVSAGQVDVHHTNIEAPDGQLVTKDGAILPSAAAAAARAGNAASSANASNASGDTIPLAKADPTTTFFTALATFSGCLRQLGVKFIGAPDQSNPNSPSNNPDYIKNLSTCAAKSNILQALKDEQAAQDNLTPKQIQDQNKAYLLWRTCMIGRGWGIPQPTPDSKGRLFSFGGASSGSGSGSTPGFTPPPGQDILTSTDLSACASQVQQQNPKLTSGG